MPDRCIRSRFVKRATRSMVNVVVPPSMRPTNQYKELYTLLGGKRIIQSGETIGTAEDATAAIKNMLKMDTATKSESPMPIINSGPTDAKAEAPPTSDLGVFSNVKMPKMQHISKKGTGSDDYGAIAIQELVAKPIDLGVYTINASTTGDVFSLDFPDVLFNSPKFTAIFTNYVFAAYDIEITLLPSGSPQQTGLFALYYFVNYGRSAVYGRTPPEHFSLPHVVISPCMEEAATLVIPWSSRRRYDTVNIYSSQMQKLVLTTVLPLTVGTNSPATFEVQVFASIKNIRSDIARNTQMFDTVNSMVIENMRDGTLPVNMTGQSLDFQTSTPFAMDKPTDTRNYNQVIATPYQNTYNDKSTLVGRRATLTGKDLTLTPSCVYHTDINEMSFEYFKKLWFQLGQPFKWAQSAAVGTLLTSFDIRPLSKNMIQCTMDPTAPSPTSYFGQGNGNIIDFMTSQFSSWRGSMRYRLFLGLNQFYNGKLFVSIKYGPDALPTTISSTSIDPKTTYGFFINLNSSCYQYDFEVPFRFIYDFAHANDCIGQVGIYVVTPLKTTLNVSSTVNMRLYYGLGDDMQFFNYAPSAVSTQAGECTSFKPVDNKTIPSCLTMDRFLSVKQLLMVPHNIINMSMNGPGGYPNDTLVLDLTDIGMAAFFTSIGRYFTGWRGSLRYIIRTSGLVPGDTIHVQYFRKKAMNVNPTGTVTYDDLGYMPTTSFNDEYVLQLGTPATGQNFVSCRSACESSPVLAGLQRVDTIQQTNFSGFPQTLINDNYNTTLVGSRGRQVSVLDARTSEVVIEVPWMRKENFDVVDGYCEGGMLNFVYINSKNGATNGGKPMQWPINHVISVDVMAGDDFQFMFYSGLPAVSTTAGMTNSGTFNNWNYPPNLFKTEPYTQLAYTGVIGTVNTNVLNNALYPFMGI